jgi:hypothetical protein
LASFFLWLWFGLVAVISSFISLYLLMFLAINPTPWNFPGDPPLFELSLAGALANLILVVPLWLLLRWPPARAVSGSSLRPLVRVVSTCWLVVALVCIAGILERQGPRWREVRTAIRLYGNAIAADAGDRHRVLNHDEFVALRQKHVPTPVPLSLAGFGTVHLRMAHGVYPYVGIDFGGGSNALFDSWSMFCTYSD